MDKIYLSIAFKNTKKTYYFYTNDDSIEVNDCVLVETVVGKELGKVVDKYVVIKKEFEPEIKPILSKASPTDIKIDKDNEELAKHATQVFLKAIKDLKIDIRHMSTEYTFDRSKVLFIYASDERIDFRELLKVLAYELHCRIELRQINSRERAQTVGGIGICGLELCCTSFFKTQESISLNKAKNQMLAINIPKLSGQCGKLICCLKFEDEMYTELKKEFPKVGTSVKYEGKEYKITGYNVLTKVCKIESDDSIQFIELKDLKINEKQ